MRFGGEEDAANEAIKASEYPRLSTRETSDLTEEYLPSEEKPSSPQRIPKHFPGERDSKDVPAVCETW